MASQRADGGAVEIFSYDEVTAVTIRDSAFIGNTSATEGGAISVRVYNAAVIPPMEWSNNLFLQNKAENAGGAIAVWQFNEGKGQVQIAVTNNTFVSNAAGKGGAIYATPPGVKIANNTLVNNQAAAKGGALYLASQAQGTKISNTLLSGNTVSGAPSTCDLENPGGVIALYNLATDSSCGAGFTEKTASELAMGALKNWGGATGTVPLLPGSAAIDAGDDVSCPLTDQRGIARPQLAHCDVGAYEAQPYTLRILQGDKQYTPIRHRFDLPLNVQVRGAKIDAANTEPTDGGHINLVGPASGASIAPAVRSIEIQNGRASARVKANDERGAFLVNANASGIAAPAAFHLTNVQSDALLLAPASNAKMDTRRVTFEWEPLPNAGGVVIYTLTVKLPGRAAFQKDLVDTTQFTVPRLEPGKSYTWSVKMCEASQCITSATWSFNITPRAK